MADPQSNATPPAHPEIPAGAPPSGVIHIRHRHTDRFTVVGNHLAQHADLSAAAIGLAVFIQSLPDGVSVTAKALALRFREGETTVRRALNELERFGYLARPRVPLGGGRFATRTLAYDNPGRVASPPRGPVPAPPPPPASKAPEPPPQDRPDPRARRSDTRARAHAQPPAEPPPRPRPRPGSDGRHHHHHRPAAERPAPDTRPVAAPDTAPGPRPDARSLPRPDTAHPQPPAPPTGRAGDLLARLRLADARLALSALDVRRLAPAVDTWFARSATADQITRTLTAGLPAEPEQIRHPARFLEYRLTHLLPPPLPAVERRARPAPFVTCDGCERAFRSHDPGPEARCAECRAEPVAA